MNNEPLFSIVVPTKNRAELLPTLIESVLNQEYDKFELIIADNDDCNRSDTQKIVSRYSDSRIKYYRTGNLSMAENWNYGYSKISGDYILLMRDKYVIKPHSLIILNHYIQKYKAEVISWKWNNVLLDDDDWKLITGSFSIIPYTADDFLSWFFEMGNKYHQFLFTLPIGANTCLSHELYEKIILKTGQMSFENAPDYTLGYQIIFNCKEIYHLDLTLYGAFEQRLKYSTGNLHDSGQLDKAMDAMNSKSTNLISVNNQPLKLANTESIIIEDFLRVSDRYKLPYTFHNFNLGGYFSMIYSQTVQRYATAIALYGMPNHKYFSKIRKYIKSTVKESDLSEPEKKDVSVRISHADRQLILKIILIKGYVFYQFLHRFIILKILKTKSKYF